MSYGHRGKLSAPIVVVGDAPSAYDARVGKAFSGTLGELVDDLLFEAGLPVQDTVFVNAIPRLKEGKLTNEEIKSYADSHLLPFVGLHPRKLVISFGNNPLFALGVTDTPGKVGSLRGRPQTSPHVSAPIVPSTHPYFLQKEPEGKDWVLTDLKVAAKVYNGNYVLHVPIVVKMLESPNAMRAMFAQSYGKTLAYDIETTGKDTRRVYPVTIAFYNGETNALGERVVYVWAGYDKLTPRFDEETLEEFKHVLRDQLKLAGTKYRLVGHNSISYDDYVMRYWLDIPDWVGSQNDTMLLKYAVSTIRPHGLKDTVHLRLGFANYDSELDAKVQEIVDRRGRNLVDPLDFMVLQLEGYEPNGKKWPKEADKKAYAYALVDLDILVRYNAYDAVYTWLLREDLVAEIERDNLWVTTKERHAAAKELARSEQRGILLDVKTNRTFAKQLTDIIEECKVKITNEVRRLDPTIEDFNPASNIQLRKLLFGEPVMLPFVDRKALFDRFDKRSVGVKVDEFEYSFYGDYTAVRSAIEKYGKLDLEAIKSTIKGRFRAKFKVDTNLVLKPVYINGMYMPNPLNFTKTGLPSVGGAVLNSLYDQRPEPLLALVLMYSKATKLKSTFVDAIFNSAKWDGAVHGRFNMTGTTTNRISTSGPNVQNYPKKMRGQHIPRPGYVFVDGDLAAAEVRMVAAFSGDERLIEAVNSEDIHTATASLIFGIPKEEVDEDTHRRAAKAIVFGIIYGMSAFRLANTINTTVEEAEVMIDDFFKAFPKLKEWLDNQVVLGGKHPFFVYTPWGSRRSTRNLLSIDMKMRSHAERQAKNAPIQGGAGELTLFYIRKMAERARAMGWDVHLVNTTHDSYTFEVPKDLAWRTDTGNVDKKGKPIVKADGPFCAMVLDVISSPTGIEVVDRVNFKTDLAVNDYWNGPPDLKLALDPSYGKDESRFRWDYLNPEMAGLSDDEVAEIEEMEEAWYKSRE